MTQFDKIKLSRHQRENIDLKRPGHGYAEDESQRIIEAPVEVKTQPDGRQVFFAALDEGVVSVTVSATVSGDCTVGRVVTAHRNRLPKRQSAEQAEEIDQEGQAPEKR